MIELPVEPLDLTIASQAGTFYFHALTVAFDPGQICFCLGPKNVEVYRYD